MKYSNKELPHAWAHQRDSQGKGSNMFFMGPVIYSYGTHFPVAKRLNGSLFLFTSKSYSSTTAKHKSYILRAIPVDPIIVPNVLAKSKEEHNANTKHLIDEAKELYAGIERARKAYKKIHTYKQFLKQREKVSIYIYAFEVKGFASDVKALSNLRQPFTDDYLRELEEKEGRQKEQAKERNRVKMQVEVEEWRNGTRYSLSGNHPDVLLRVQENELQTSMGAKVSVPAAKRLYKMWKKCTDCIEGESINGYEVQRANSLEIKIGCHLIKADEINRLAKQMKW